MASHDELRLHCVMTFNIRYNNPLDGPDAWPKRKDDVGAFLKNVNPDFLGLQEVLHDQLLDVAGALEETHDWVGVGRSDGKEAGEYNPIFYNKSRYVLERWDTFWLSPTPEIPGSKFPGAGSPRLCTVGKFRDRTKQLPVYFLNTHLDNASSDARIFGATLIGKRFKELLPDTGSIPAFLTGDFNCGPTEEPHRVIINETDMRSAVDIAIHKKAAPTFTGFDDSFSETIDFIFANSAIVDAGLYEVSLAKTSTGRNLSDHRPVGLFTIQAKN